MKKSQKTKKPEKYKKIKIMFGYIKILLLLIIIFWIISYFSSFLIETFSPKFDPKIHTCDEWCKCLCDCSSVSISYNENTDELFLDNCCSKDSSGAWQQQTCTLWHDTTFCEMCQETPLEEWHIFNYLHDDSCNNACVCDKKGESSYSVFVTNSTYREYFYKVTEIELNKFRNMPDVVLYYTKSDFTNTKCFSAREKTKCEKDDPDYILVDSDDWTSIYECNCQDLIIEMLNINIEYCDTCYDYEKVCRKKTIDDYSCDELKRHIWFEDTYCNSKQEWNTKCFDKLYVKDIKKIYIEKGCEI